MVQFINVEVGQYLIPYLGILKPIYTSLYSLNLASGRSEIKLTVTLVQLSRLVEKIPLQ